MVLMKPGVWHDTVWADRTWSEDLWLEYGTAKPPTPSGIGGPVVRHPYRPTRRKATLPEDMVQLLIAYLELKLGE